MKKLVIFTAIFLSGLVAKAEQVVSIDQLDCTVSFQGKDYTMAPDTAYDKKNTLVLKAFHSLPDSKVAWIEASVLISGDGSFLTRQLVANLTSSDGSGQKTAYATIETPNTDHKNTRTLISNGVAGIYCYAK